MSDRLAYIQIFSDIATERMNNNQCPNCGKPKSEWERRTDWRCCSVECTGNFWKEHDKSISWSGLRTRIFKRDNWACKMCGKREAYFSEYHKREFGHDEKLIADHIKPISIGGDMWNEDNLQTLCIDCNKIKTANDMKVIADHRRLEKVLNKNKQLAVEV